MANAKEVTVDIITGEMGDLQCQENDKKDVSSETIDNKETFGNLGPSLCPIGVGFMSNSENHEPLDEDDPKLFMKICQVISHMKPLQTAVAVPLLQVVKPFNGVSVECKRFVKDIEGCVQLAKLGNADILSIVHISFTVSVADFVQKCMDYEL